jgi:hypothetical protein
VQLGFTIVTLVGFIHISLRNKKKSSRPLVPVKLNSGTAEKAPACNNLVLCILVARKDLNTGWNTLLTGKTKEEDNKKKTYKFLDKFIVETLPK